MSREPKCEILYYIFLVSSIGKKITILYSSIEHNTCVKYPLGKQYTSVLNGYHYCFTSLFLNSLQCDMLVCASCFHDYTNSLELQVCLLKQTLPALDQNYAAREEKDTCIFSLRK